MTELNYDAILEATQYAQIGDYKVAYGKVYEDKKRRFNDGDGIRTSVIEKEFEVDGVKYIKTLNTTYKLRDDK